MANDKWLEGKVAFVTGAAGGLGLELSRGLGAAGARLMLADVDAARVEAARATLTAEGLTAAAVTFDVTDPAGWAAAAADTQAAFGEVDLLCNNAGVVGVQSAPLGLSVEALRWAFDINVVGVMLGFQTFAPAMIARRSGRILNTSSMTGLDTINVVAGYSATKHALLSLSQAMRDEMAPHGVAVSVVCPGGIATDILKRPKPGGSGPAAAAATPAPDDEAKEAMRNAAIKASGGGMDPKQAAAITIAGLREGGFYIFTHREGRGRLQARVQEMMGGFDRLDRSVG